MKIIGLLLISLKLGIFNIQSGFEEFANQGFESYHTLLYIMIIFGTYSTFHKTLLLNSLAIDLFHLFHIQNLKYCRLIFELYHI